MPTLYKFIPNSSRMDAETVATYAADSPYRWWFECLKASHVYRENCRNPEALTGKAKKVYEVFGKIRPALTFDIWWKRHGRKFFAELQGYRQVLLIDTPMFIKPDPRTYLLQIPKEMSARSVVRQVKAELKTYYGQNRIDPRQNSTAALKLHGSRVKMDTVERSLEIWGVAHNEMAGHYLYELGEKLKVSYVQMPVDGDDYMTQKDKRGKMSIAVSRYIRQAELLMANAAEGKFPCLDANPRAQSRLTARRSALLDGQISGFVLSKGR